MSVHQSDPFLADALARILATAPDASLRNGEGAVQLAAGVFRDNPTPAFGETLAMAFAEAGDFGEAVALQQRILEQRRAAGQEIEVARAERWLEAYRNGEPVRSPWQE